MIDHIREVVPLDPKESEEEIFIPLTEVLEISKSWAKPSGDSLKITYDIIQRLKEIRGLRDKSQRDLKQEVKSLKQRLEKANKEIERKDKKNQLQKKEIDKLLKIDEGDSIDKVKEKYIKKVCIERHEDYSWDEISKTLDVVPSTLVKWRKRIFDKSHPCHPAARGSNKEENRDP